MEISGMSNSCTQDWGTQRSLQLRHFAAIETGLQAGNELAWAIGSMYRLSASHRYAPALKVV